VEVAVVDGDKQCRGVGSISLLGGGKRGGGLGWCLGF
jgi:hypothetical protein